MRLEAHYTIPGQVAQKVALDQATLMIGSLLSNQIILPVAGVDPIHGLIEHDNQGRLTITDLGSQQGILLNGQKIEVESNLNVGDQLTIGTVIVEIREAVTTAATPPPPGVNVPPPPKTGQVVGRQSKDITAKSSKEKPKKDIPLVQKSKEIRAKTKLDSIKSSIDQSSRGPSRIQPTSLNLSHTGEDLLFKKNDTQSSGELLEVIAYWGNTIIDVEHFHPALAGFDKVTIGDSNKCHFMAAGPKLMDQYTIASVKNNGYKLQLTDQMSAFVRKNGKMEKISGTSIDLGKKDISQVTIGAIKYFFLFMNPPQVTLPRSGPKDPFFTLLMTLSTLFYLTFTATLWVIDPPKEEHMDDDLWSIVHVPEKKVEIPKAVELKKEPPPPAINPPKPKPKPVEKAKVEEPEKPKPAPKPQEKPAKMEDNLLKSKTQAPPPKLNADSPKNGIAGSGDNKAGGQRKGKSDVSARGVEGLQNNKSSGVNLGKLGLGVGKIKSVKGAGALYTNFKSSAGGAGGGQGSGAKTFGLGGSGVGTKSLGLAGSSSAVNSFGSGKGVLNGKGKLDSAFGSGKKNANVNLTAGDPLVSGGLTQEEILATIRMHLNAIRHCYEKLLQRAPESTGKIKVRFIVDLGGRVSSTNITETSIKDKEMQGCLTDNIRRWEFPKPRGKSPVTVNYPFTFNPL